MKIEKHKPILIIGLGKTGFSVARFLHQRAVPFRVMDDRKAPPFLDQLQVLCPNTEVSIGRFIQRWLDTSQVSIISPGVSSETPSIARAIARNSRRVMSDIELFSHYQNPLVPTVAISGTNGKTTVTKMITHIASSLGIKAKAAGNCSPPVMELLDNNDACFHILEISSFQLEHTKSLKPTVSVLLNISPDHLDRYPNFTAYAAIKQRIHQNSIYQVFNRHCPSTYPTNGGRHISIGIDTPAKDHFGMRGEKLSPTILFGDMPLMHLGNSRLRGVPGALNIQAALGVSTLLSWPLDKVILAIRDFHSPPHRMQSIGRHNGTTWVDDSKATNVEAAVQALRTTGHKTVLICGGHGKKNDYTELSTAIRHYKTHTILIGNEAQNIADAIGDASLIFFAKSMQDAVKQAAESAPDKGTVLLAPACASFDMFDSYVQRGECFVNCFHQLKHAG